MKTERSKKGIYKYLILLIILGLVYLLFIFVHNIYLIKFIKLSRSPGDNGSIVSSWDGKNSITLFITYDTNLNGYYVNTYNALLSVNPSTKNIYLLAIPNSINIYTSVSALQKVDTIYPLNNLNQPQDGLDVLMNDLDYNFAIPVNSYISFNSDSINNLFINHLDINSNVNFSVSKSLSIHIGENNLSLDDMRQILSYVTDNENSLYIKNLIFQGIFSQILNPVNLFNPKMKYYNLSKVFYSNLNGNNMFKLISDIYNIGVNQIQFIDIFPAVSNNTLSLSSLDSILRQNYINSSFENSNVSVQILDSANDSNATYQLSRYIENLGGTISSIGTYPSTLYKSTIYVSGYSQYKYEVQMIENILGKNNVNIVYSNPAFFYTGSIIVVLGTLGSSILP